jgi:hypothetical protein
MSLVDGLNYYHHITLASSSTSPCTDRPNPTQATFLLKQRGNDIGLSQGQSYFSPVKSFHTCLYLAIYNQALIYD